MRQKCFIEFGWRRKHVVALVAALIAGSVCRAQTAQQILQTAVNSEFAADSADHSNWTYRDHDVQPGKDEWSIAVETPQGSLSRVVMRDGKTLSAAERDAETERISHFVGDAAAQAKRRKANQHDDEQSAELMHMLPTAFLWKVQSETPEFVTLRYEPNPDFVPPNMEARVMSAMAGEVIIAREGNRIRTLRGALAHDVKFGLGLLGKMYQGGTFDIERREVGGGHWQITETHVHIGGHALLFKNIGQQEDEVKVDWKPSPARTLREAEEYLRMVK